MYHDSTLWYSARMNRRRFLSFLGLSPAVGLVDKKHLWDRLKEFLSGPRYTTLSRDVVDSSYIARTDVLYGWGNVNEMQRSYNYAQSSIAEMIKLKPRQPLGLAFHRDAFLLGCADLPKPSPVAWKRQKGRLRYERRYRRNAA